MPTEDGSTLTNVRFALYYWQSLDCAVVTESFKFCLEEAFQFSE